MPRPWDPPVTLRSAVRRALDRVDCGSVDEARFARELQRELHTAGYRIDSADRVALPPLPPDAGRPMSAAEAQLFGFADPVDTNPAWRNRSGEDDVE